MEGHIQVVGFINWSGGAIPNDIIVKIGEDFLQGL